MKDSLCASPSGWRDKLLGIRRLLAEVKMLLFNVMSSYYFPEKKEKSYVKHVTLV